MTICPECGKNESVITAVESIDEITHFVLFCLLCEHDWTEDVTWTEKDLLNMNSDALILGLAIFETGNKCLYLLNGHFSHRSKEICIKELDELLFAAMEAEKRWGRLGMYKMFKECNVMWGEKMIIALQKYEETIIKKRAEGIISYLNTFVV